jgi:hypothetical protein
MSATEIMTLLGGYDAMRIFIEAVQRRDGGTSEEFERLVGALKRADGAPADSTARQA